MRCTAFFAVAVYTYTAFCAHPLRWWFILIPHSLRWQCILIPHCCKYTANSGASLQICGLYPITVFFMFLFSPFFWLWSRFVSRVKMLWRVNFSPLSSYRWRHHCILFIYFSSLILTQSGAPICDGSSSVMSYFMAGELKLFLKMQILYFATVPRPGIKPGTFGLQIWNYSTELSKA